MPRSHCGVLGEEITTATDVYALGVLLYELLAGHRPFELDGKSASQIERAVVRDPPARPSTVAADGGSSDSPGRRRRLDGDLDTIALKALRKEPLERYDSPRALADDLRRYREGQPIAARPATVGYQVRKFVGRHWWGVASAAAVALALVAFGVLMAWQQGVTRRERDRARAAEEQAAAINQFLVDEMLGAAAPEVAQGRDVSVLAAAAQRIEGAFEGQPGLEASVRRTLGELYLRLGQLDEAETHLERSRELLDRELGADHPDTLSTRRLLGELAIGRGEFDRAAAGIAEVLDVQLPALGPAHPEVWASEGALARAELEKGDYGAAESRLQTLLASPAALAVPEQARTDVEGLLADIYARQRRWIEVEDVASRVLASQRRLLGPNHPALARTLSTLGLAQSRNKRFPAGQASLEAALELRERVLGEDHPETLESLRSLLIHHSITEEWDRAAGYGGVAAERARRVYGPDHPWTIRAEENVAVIHTRRGRHDLAEPIYRDTARRHERVLGLAHPSINRSYRNLNGALLGLGRTAEAREVAEKALASERARLAEGDEDATFLSDFAYHLVTMEPADVRSPEEALPLAERAVELTGREWDDALNTLARVHFKLGNLDQAIELQREVLSHPATADLAEEERAAMPPGLRSARDFETAP